MNIKHLEVGPRTILTDDGEPVLVQLAMRESTTAPSRIKAVLALPTTNDDGSEGIMPMPFAQAVMAEPGKKARGFAVEFRLEMN
jgi:hypothetical protein